MENPEQTAIVEKKHSWDLSPMEILEIKIAELFDKEYDRIENTVALDNWILSVYYEKNSYTMLYERVMLDIYDSIFADEVITSFVLGLTLAINQMMSSCEQYNKSGVGQTVPDSLYQHLCRSISKGYKSLWIGNAKSENSTIPTYIAETLDYSGVDVVKIIDENKIILTVLLIHMYLNKTNFFKTYITVPDKTA